MAHEVIKILNSLEFPGTPGNMTTRQNVHMKGPKAPAVYEAEDVLAAINTVQI